jgi:hypothetical protein
VPTTTPTIIGDAVPCDCSPDVCPRTLTPPVQDDGVDDGDSLDVSDAVGVVVDVAVSLGVAVADGDGVGLLPKDGVTDGVSDVDAVSETDDVSELLSETVLVKDTVSDGGMGVYTPGLSGGPGSMMYSIDGRFFTSHELPS